MTLPFQFTCPSRSTTRPSYAALTDCKFQFTCPSRSTTSFGAVSMMTMSVSIHVPLAEHDTYRDLLETDTSSFNSRAPRGARRDNTEFKRAFRQFQFTCPSRSTTGQLPGASLDSLVSIHVPLAEHDAFPSSAGAVQKFQFTCPSRSTTSKSAK